MKKIAALILALTLTLSLCSCFHPGTKQDVKEIVSSTDETEPGTQKEKASEDGKKDDKKSELPTIQEQVCFENLGVKVTAKSMVNDFIWGSGVKLLIENDSAKTYSVMTDAVIVNDCMVSALFSSKVAGGKKVNDTLYLSSSDLEAAGIEKIGKIEIYFRIYDSESWETVYHSSCVTIKTSLYDEMDTVSAADSGQELFNKNGIRIVGKYVDENSFWGASVLLYIENKTAKDVTVSCREMSVNGFMVTPIFVSTVYSEKYAVDAIEILSSDLEENEITSVENIELKFHIYDNHSYTTIADTPSISFSVK